MLALAAGRAATPPPALADGDPASDVLATQKLFLPQDAAIPPAQQTQLAAVLEEAARAGYSLRVALIASATDLGSVTELWRQPQSYALFLGQELAFAYRGPLLVVMPNGLGLYNVPRAGRVAVSGTNPSAGLGSAAVSAVRSLAVAAGHPIALPSTGAGAGGAGGGGNALPWVAFAVGAILVAASWTASLRARPLGRRSTLPDG